MANAFKALWTPCVVGKTVLSLCTACAWRCVECWRKAVAMCAWAMALPFWGRGICSRDSWEASGAWTIARYNWTRHNKPSASLSWKTMTVAHFMYTRSQSRRLPSEAKMKMKKMKAMQLWRKALFLRTQSIKNVQTLEKWKKERKKERVCVSSLLVSWASWWPLAGCPCSKSIHTVRIGSCGRGSVVRSSPASSPWTCTAACGPWPSVAVGIRCCSTARACNHHTGPVCLSFADKMNKHYPNLCACMFKSSLLMCWDVWGEGGNCFDI